MNNSAPTNFEAKIQHSESKICLVTGATGVVGVPLVRKLMRDGHAVRILARNEVVARGAFPGEVQIFRGDLANVKTLERASDGAQWVFHLAAKLHVNNPGKDLEREYGETNVGGTARLLDAANGVEKFIFFSTINVYGPSDKKIIFDESDKISPEGFYAESKAAAEDSVLAAPSGVVLRLAAVYGSRMKGNYLRLLDALRRGRFLLVGDGRNRRTIIHQEDAARAAILAAERAVGGSIYNVTDNAIHTFAEIIAAMSRALGKPAPKMRLPLAPVGFGIGLAEDLGKVFGVRSPVNRALLDKLLEDVAVSGAKINQELGFRPQFDLTTGWRETIAGQTASAFGSLE